MKTKYRVIYRDSLEELEGEGDLIILGEYLTSLAKGEVVREVGDRLEISIKVEEEVEALSKKELSNFIRYISLGVELGLLREEVLENSFLIFLRELEERIEVGETITLVK